MDKSCDTVCTRHNWYIAEINIVWTVFTAENHHIHSQYYYDIQKWTFSSLVEEWNHNTEVIHFSLSVDIFSDQMYQKYWFSQMIYRPNINPTNNYYIEYF